MNIIQALFGQTWMRQSVQRIVEGVYYTKRCMTRLPAVPLSFNFVMDEIMEDCLRHTSPSGVDILSGDKLSDLDYADGMVLLFDKCYQIE